MISMCVFLVSKVVLQFNTFLSLCKTFISLCIECTKVIKWHYINISTGIWSKIVWYLIVSTLPSPKCKVYLPFWRARSRPCALHTLSWACIGSQWWYLSDSRSGRSRLCGTPGFFSETPPSASGSWAQSSPSAYVNLQHTQKLGERISEMFS